MNLSEFGSMWKLMSDYSFEIDSDSIHDNLICIICNKLMVDACESVCGCNYCYNCIDSYLCNGDRYCPGSNSACKDGYLVMSRDVFRNLRLNKNIYKLKVLCPNEYCQLKIELSEMTEHLHVCTKQSIECPYLNIGCDNDRINKDTMLNHLSNDLLLHTQLLIECIQNLKNEVNELKVNVEDNKFKMSTLRDDLTNKDIQMMEQKREIDRLKDEFMLQGNRIAILEEQLLELKNHTDVRMCEEKEERMKLVEELIEDIERVKNDAKTERDNMTVAVNDLNVIREDREKGDEYSDGTMLRWTKMCGNIDADFLWRIDGYTKKIGTYIDSESFYTNNYKLCLRLYIDSDGSVGLHYRIMKGDNDDKALWPLIRAVTLAVIDQATLKAHKTMMYKYDTYEGNKSVFDRPRNNADIWIGYGYYWSIKDTPSVIVKDSIVVSCVVTDR